MENGQRNGQEESRKQALEKNAKKLSQIVANRKVPEQEAEAAGQGEEQRRQAEQNNEIFRTNSDNNELNQQIARNKLAAEQKKRDEVTEQKKTKETTKGGGEDKQKKTKGSVFSFLTKNKETAEKTNGSGEETDTGYDENEFSIASIDSEILADAADDNTKKNEIITNVVVDKTDNDSTLHEQQLSQNRKATSMISNGTTDRLKSLNNNTKLASDTTRQGTKENIDLLKSATIKTDELRDKLDLQNDFSDKLRNRLAFTALAVAAMVASFAFGFDGLGAAAGVVKTVAVVGSIASAVAGVGSSLNQFNEMNKLKTLDGTNGQIELMNSVTNSIIHTAKNQEEQHKKASNEIDKSQNNIDQLGDAHSKVEENKKQVSADLEKQAASMIKNRTFSNVTAQTGGQGHFSNITFGKGKGQDQVAGTGMS